MPVIPFLFVFIAGLGAGVYSMFQGVTPGPTARGTTRFGMISAPSVAAFAIIFGAVGYLCATRTTLSYPLTVAIAIGGGAATIPLSAPLTAKLARGRKAIISSQFELEGQLATVSKPITRDEPGEVVFERDGKNVRTRAVHIGEGELAIGDDVVIDRIENEIAYVEDWDTVEQRL